MGISSSLICIKLSPIYIYYICFSRSNFSLEFALYFLTGFREAMTVMNGSCFLFSFIEPTYMYMRLPQPRPQMDEFTLLSRRFRLAARTAVISRQKNGLMKTDTPILLTNSIKYFGRRL